MSVIGTLGAVAPAHYGTAKAAVHRGIHEAGGPKALAARLGRSASTVYPWANPNTRWQAPWSAVCDMVAAGAIAPVHHLCAIAGGRFAPSARTNQTVPQLIGAAAKEVGEAVNAAVPAIADGRIDAAERGICLKEIDEALAALTSLRSAMASAS